MIWRLPVVRQGYDFSVPATLERRVARDLKIIPHHKKNHSLTTMSAADDQNTAITTPERRNNSGILTADAGRPAGWGWGSAIRSLVANNTTTPTTAMATAITTAAATPLLGKMIVATTKTIPKQPIVVSLIRN